MIAKSVGRKGVNKSDDIKTIQQIMNLRSDLRKTLPKLIVDGKYGAKTQAIIDQVQSGYTKTPTGLIKPYDSTLQKIWIVAYGKPTGLAIRGTDSYGAGEHGASRGKRTHDGTDYKSTAGQQVKAPLSGKVTKISRPYSSGVDAHTLSGIEIEASDGTKCWVWYIQPSGGIVGKVVKAGVSIIGVAKTLKNRYKNGITDHVHIRIHKKNGVKVNPSTVIR